MKDFEEYLKNFEDKKDLLGQGLDPEIKYAVAAFNYHGFTTTMSCAGHLESWGTPYPWIEIKKNYPTFDYLNEMLDSFYLNRETNCLRLQAVRFVREGKFIRVQSCSELPTSNDVKIFHRDSNILIACRQEMNDFAKFLIDNK